MDKERKRGVAPSLYRDERHPVEGLHPTTTEVQKKVELLNQKAKKCEGQLVMVVSRNWESNRFLNRVTYSLKERFYMGTLEDPFIQIEEGIGNLIVGVKEQVYLNEHFVQLGHTKKGPIRDNFGFCQNLDRLSGQKSDDRIFGLAQKKLLEIIIGDQDVYAWVKDEVSGKHNYTEEELEFRRKLREESPIPHNIGINSSDLASFQKMARLFGKEFGKSADLQLPPKESYLKGHIINSRRYIIRTALEIKAILREQSADVTGLSKEDEQFIRRATDFLKRAAKGKEILDNQENGLKADIKALTAFRHASRAFQKEPEGWDIGRLAEYLQVLESIKSGHSLQEIDLVNRVETYNFFKALAKTLFEEEMSESIEETSETNPLRMSTNGRKRLQMNVWTRKDETPLSEDEKKE